MLDLSEKKLCTSREIFLPNNSTINDRERGERRELNHCEAANVKNGYTSYTQRR